MQLSVSQMTLSQLTYLKAEFCNYFINEDQRRPLRGGLEWCLLNNALIIINYGLQIVYASTLES